LGGNAIKNTFTRRYEAKEYYKASEIIVDKLLTLFPNRKLSIIKSYRNKESFGDIDILIKSQNTINDDIKAIKDKFKPKEFVRNSHIISFDFNELQVDVIFTNNEDYEASVQYFSYNDLNNILGIICHSLGLKLGHDGLSYNFREGTNNYRNVVLSTDWEVVCKVLMLDYKTFVDGFDELEDIFKFVVSSPFFNKEIFSLENRNHAARVRDNKRKTYTEFLKWIEDDNNLEDDIYYFPKVENKYYWLPHLFDNIPNFEPMYNKVMDEWLLDKKFKLRYNGEIVSELTGLKGKELGEFMKWTKEYHAEDKLKMIINTINAECIDDFILHNYNVYTGNLFNVEIPQTYLEGMK